MPHHALHHFKNSSASQSISTVSCDNKAALRPWQPDYTAMAWTQHYFEMLGGGVGGQSADVSLSLIKYGIL